ncbi:NYN domain-containing protein [Mycoplasmopsis synoviae]|nr:NYN domain-containing protein [Mycoplasmopsis synoviae]
MDIFCIATSDSDFVYLLQKLKSKNKYVILACESVASPWLKENAHEVFEENPIDTNKDLETNINENYLLDLLEEKIAPEKQLVVQEAQISNNENQAEKKNSRRRKRNRKKLKKANVNEITSEVQKVVLVENSETQNTETEKVE